MYRISNKDINITHHKADGFTLSHRADDGGYYKARYIGYSMSQAIALFKHYVLVKRGEENKLPGK